MRSLFIFIFAQAVSKHLYHSTINNNHPPNLALESTMNTLLYTVEVTYFPLFSTFHHVLYVYESMRKHVFSAPKLTKRCNLNNCMLMTNSIKQGHLIRLKNPKTNWWVSGLEGEKFGNYADIDVAQCEDKRGMQLSKVLWR